MGSFAEPVGSIPSKEDVKETVTAASSKATETETPKAVAEDEISEADLETIQEQKSVPYSRFKEVNDKAKLAREELAAMESRLQRDRERIYEEADLRAQARIDQLQKQAAAKAEVSDPYEAKDLELQGALQQQQEDLKSLRAQMAEQNLKRDLEILQAKYPKADQEAVLGWKRAKPGASLDDLMERSHNKIVDLATEIMKDAIDKRKNRAKAAIPTRESGLKLKDSERPKTVKEATAIAKRFFSNQ